MSVGALMVGLVVFLQARKRAVAGAQPRWHPDLGLPAPELGEKKSLLLKPRHGPWYCVMAP